MNFNVNNFFTLIDLPLECWLFFLVIIFFATLGLAPNLFTKFRMKLRGYTFKKIGGRINFISSPIFSDSEVLKTIKKCSSLYEPCISLKAHNIIEGTYKNNYWIIFDMESEIPAIRVNSWYTVIYTNLQNFEISDFEIGNCPAFSKIAGKILIIFLKVLGWQPSPSEEKGIILNNALFSKKYFLLANVKDEEHVRDLFSREVVDFFTKNVLRFNIITRNNKVIFYFRNTFDNTLKCKDLLSFLDKANTILTLFKTASDSYKI